MAKYTLGSGVIQFKGSSGGATFQKCGKVFAIRKRNVPVQKNSIRQTRFKSAFNCQQKRWKTLTPTQKGTFNTRAPEWPRVDSLGNTYYLTGQQLQTSTNQKRFTLAMSQVSTVAARITPTVFTEAAWGLDAQANSLQLQMSQTNVEAGTVIALYASDIMPTQQSFTLADLKFIERLSAGANMNTKNWINTFKKVFPVRYLSESGWIAIYYQVCQVGVTQELFSVQGWCIADNPF